MRALGIDLGTARIGVAVSDSDGLVATPYEVVARSGQVDRDRARLLELADETGAEIIVIGLPLNMDGSTGPAARAAQAEVEAMRDLTSVPITTHDERLTTVTADRALQAQGLGAPARRKVVDKVAAAVMLQAWLDHRRSAPDPDPGTGLDAEGLTVGSPRPRRRRTRR